MSETTALTETNVATQVRPAPGAVAEARARDAAEAAQRKPETRSPEQLESDITEARKRLAGTIDDIADRVSPKKVASRTTADVKEKATAAAEQAKLKANAFFHKPSGELDTIKVGAVAGALVLVVAVKVIAKVRTRG